MLPTNEVLIDLYLERTIDLMRLEAGTARKVLALLKSLEKDLVVEIARVDPTGTLRERYQRDRMSKLLANVKEIIRAAYRGVNSVMIAELRELADVEAAWTVGSFNSAIGVEFVDTQLTRGFLETLVSDTLIQGAPTKEWWGRQAAGLVQKFSDEIRRGVAAGESNAVLIDRIRGTATQRGVMDISETSAARLIRASVQTIANTAREKTYADNSDIIASLQWHATLDTKTSPWCYARDGKHYTPVEHKPIDSDIPWLEGPGKLHWGCRSTSVPVLKTWRALGIDADEIPPGTRSSMDGQVPAPMTFEKWLEKQSYARQKTVLGDTKVDLWRAGKITFRDMLDQNGRPLTVEELRKKVYG